ncbi:MAG: hypothetical protein US27_C0006G0002 [Candidatus Moranbacteria bacterium GW2011_GWF1_36_78]|nr:MAG: hypothetical protein US27_C0006G0002 [Candidatus Moranbacteria bacterium GW2011_GWF1_36_78]
MRITDYESVHANIKIMTKKIVVSFLFISTFFLVAGKAEAVCTNNSLGALLNGVQSYTGCASASSLMIWSCAGQDAVTSSVTSCTTPDGRGYCSGNKCKLYGCINDSQCSSDSNPCTKLSTCNLVSHTCTAEINVSDGTSCGVGKYCYSGNCKTKVGLGDVCSTNFICSDNGTYCGPANRCICSAGLGNCADDSDTCLCRFDLGWDCKTDYNSDRRRFEETCQPPRDSGPVAPSLTFSANPSVITLGESTTLSYIVGNNADFCTASTTSVGAGIWAGWKLATNGTHISVPPIVPTTIGTKTYSISCSNDGGTRTKSVSVTVNPVSLPSLPCISCSDEDAHCRGSYVDRCGATCTGTKDCNWREVTP